MTRDPRVARLERAGAILGKTWQSRLAAAAGISPALMSSIVSGERRMTEEVEAKIAVALHVGVTPGLRRAADALDAIATEMEADLSLSPALELTADGPSLGDPQ
ncbi:helix-turn-helix domain-containing protein [Chenggangzhangella methanolivorans]|uniref:Helix-turn-helix domain-containing protein n=1 Tax=Chenggangzhangella methanolivorans TaxID=1437009 RepID=A0A9E6R9E3_9HYPH|nr:helix-turn-helix transcriptional regulator [Chenggangzhangella methanolivorans]QZO00623.1 helix-turn-helix domain-containing protein [Chenggangzhangella methanolivorans]